MKNPKGLNKFLNLNIKMLRLINNNSKEKMF